MYIFNTQNMIPLYFNQLLDYLLSCSEGAGMCGGFDGWGSRDLGGDNHGPLFSGAVGVPSPPEVVVVVLINRINGAAGPRVQLCLKHGCRLRDKFSHEFRFDKVVSGVEQGAEWDRLLCPRLSHQSHHSPPIKGKTCGKAQK